MKKSHTVSLVSEAVPPSLWFVMSASFRYLGPSFAVLLFSRMDVLAVAWFRITGAAVVFAFWTKPWRVLKGKSRESIVLIVLLGLCLAMMNTAFYLAIDRLPLSLVAIIEFLGTIVVAVFGLRTARNYLALSTAVIGVFLLTEMRWSDDSVGLGFAAMNGLLFIAYICIGHRVARVGSEDKIGRLGMAMVFASIFITPIGFSQAVSFLTNPLLVSAGFGVGICSSVIPYVCDQLAMSRLPRSSYALMLTLLSTATATLIGAVVLGQIPTPKDLIGIGLVMIGIAVHKPPE